MRRFLKALLLLVMSAALGQTALAQVKPIAQVAGRLGQRELRVFTKDTLYQIAGDYHVSGVLIIEPGTTVEFLPDGRLIDSVGGKIIADGELDAIWDQNTAAVTSFPDRYCDIDYMRAHVAVSGRPEITASGGPNGSPNWVNYASHLLFYYANNLQRCATDPNLRFRTYGRNVRRDPIIFRGRPVNGNSEEWGHIVILPGADSAIFRNVQFVNFRKDTGVVRNQRFYNPTAAMGYSNEAIVAADILNDKMRSLTTGGGGALTTFSAKTWILNCRFDSNMARYHGGALQLLQAPWDQYVATPTGRSFYPHLPSLGASHDSNRYPAGDLNVFLDTADQYGDAISTPFGSIPIMTVTTPVGAVKQYRQLYDDGRQAANMGRIRRVYFRDNRAMVMNAIRDINGYRDDPNTSPPVINDGFIGGIAKNEAYGGAVYISGRRYDTIYFGRGWSLYLSSGGIVTDPTDTLVFERNYAANFQQDSTGGAKGGAIYVGDSTALDFQLSRFVGNYTATPRVPATDWYRRSHMSQGGGIYMSKTSPFLNIHDNVQFVNNKSGQGGAIYVESVVNPFGKNIAIYDPYLSPNLVGDSVSFIQNRAEYDGGAIYTMRNMVVQGRYITQVDAGTGAIIDHRLLFDSNSAGLAGGALAIDNQTHHSIFLESSARVLNALFSHNSAGDSTRVDDTRLIKFYDPLANPASVTNPYSVATLADRYQLPRSIRREILGGGAIYTRYGNTNLYRAVEFLRNWTIDGNGGAISMVTPVETNRYFLADGDEAYAYSPSYPGGSVLPFNDGPEPTDMRYMTRFIQNKAVKGASNTPNLRQHPRDTTTLVENTLDDPYRNGTGLGGAIYLNDRLQPVGGAPGVPRVDSVILHRVRIEQDTAWSGAAVYSDNYDLRVIFGRSLVAGNAAVSDEGRTIDTFANWQTSPAASRTAGAIFYGEIQGPLPLVDYHTGANSIYDNDARYIVRVADAPPGTFGLGGSGADTLRGNYWGETQAPVTTILPTGTQQETFFIAGDSCYLPLKGNGTVVNEQGPFESKHTYNYTPVPYGMIADTLLMEGRVYDIYDKGLDIRAVDYSGPRLAPAEEFAVGIPPALRTYPAGSQYEGKVVRRLTRDPWIADVDPVYAQLQREFVGDHPIGYPLFLESRADYLGDANTDNNDPYALNHTVFFVINVETGEFIRTTLEQMQEGSATFRSRVEFVADSIMRDPLARRDVERRAAFSIGEMYRLTPAYYLEQGFSLEEARFMAARYEDSIALDGRRYGGRVNPQELGGPGFGYINRLNMPTFVNVYAGERYRALPVLTGDRVWVISRTALWDVTRTRTEVENIARFTGLELRIAQDNSVLAPVFTGQIPSLASKTPAELRNTRFLWEDRNYTSDKTGRDTSRILDVTANDMNGFYDPRSLFFPDRYTGLRYEWSPIVEANATTPFASNDPSQIRLASWLKADTVFPAVVHANAIARDTANKWGYLRFYGRPRNPDVAPGGELLEVRVTNYPPDVATIDSLKATGQISAEEIAKYIFLYPPYFNCQMYDPVNARYLQQDTVNISSANTATYRLRIFVQDSIPIELNSAPGCFDANRNLVIAQWTDKLRFNYDVNTDDETEDNNAVSEGWDFRYGRTTYGFVFTDRQNPGQPGNTTDDAAEIRPVWMADQYLQDVNLAPDNGATVLQTGNIIVRIDDAVVEPMLRNPAQANNTYNLDSVFTLHVNDGHTGQNKFDFKVLVNAQPKLQPASGGGFTLPNAKEDFDYNPTMLDITRGVKADDLNRGQRILYYLVYADDALNDGMFQTGNPAIDENGNQRVNTATTAYVRRDTCYTEAGLWEAGKTTPSWLRINTVSGILYGTPGLNDAPRNETVTVVAIDEYGLSDVRTYTLLVDSTQHQPELRGLPPIRCIVAGTAYKDSLCVSDRDLARIAAPDRLTLRARGIVQGLADTLEFTVDPSSINGATNPDDCLPITISASSIPNTYAGRRMTVEVTVRDQVGNTDTLRYEISISQPVDFAMAVTVRNTNKDDGDAVQELIFGMAQNATTGEDAVSLGQLDSIYCEYELPPLPPTDVFDARWTIPTRNGVLRNIFPRDPSAGQERASWKAKFQPGFLEGGSPNFPIVICWSISEAKKAGRAMMITDLRSGSGPGENVAFRAYMQNPTGQNAFTVNGIRMDVRGDTACIEIIAPGIAEGFKIFYDVDTTLSVEAPITTGGEASFSLAANVPNPVTSSTEIGFYAPKRSDLRLEIFDATGKLVKTLVSESVAAGFHSSTWDGTDEKGHKVASGSYTYRLSSGSTVLSRTMILTR